MKQIVDFRIKDFPITGIETKKLKIKKLDLSKDKEIKVFK